SGAQTLPLDFAKMPRLNWPRSLSVAALLTLACWLSTSQANAADRTPVFVLSTASGETHTGPLAALGDDWSVELGGDKPSRTAGDAVISLRRQGRPLPERPAVEQLV